VKTEKSIVRGKTWIGSIQGWSWIITIIWMTIANIWKPSGCTDWSACSRLLSLRFAVEEKCTALVSVRADHSSVCSLKEFPLG